MRQFIVRDAQWGNYLRSNWCLQYGKRNEIITIVDKGEYQKLMKYINQEDPEAFITVYTVSDMRYLPKK